MWMRQYKYKSLGWLSKEILFVFAINSSRLAYPLYPRRVRKTLKAAWGAKFIGVVAPVRSLNANDHLRFWSFRRSVAILCNKELEKRVKHFVEVKGVMCFETIFGEQQPHHYCFNFHFQTPSTGKPTNYVLAKHSSIFQNPLFKLTRTHVFIDQVSDKSTYGLQIDS